MFKNIIVYCLVFAVTGFLVYYFHNNYIDDNGIVLPYSLEKVYLYFAIFSFTICSLFRLGSVINKIKEQLGFIYLGTILLKIVVFAGIFYESVFAIDLSSAQRISLIIPMAVFLFIEVFFVAKILNKTSL